MDDITIVMNIGITLHIHLTNGFKRIKPEL